MPETNGLVHFKRSFRIRNLPDRRTGKESRARAVDRQSTGSKRPQTRAPPISAVHTGVEFPAATLTSKSAQCQDPTVTALGGSSGAICRSQDTRLGHTGTE
ncbi:hypothetical protein RRG08_008278 [Elysia crispata]|uniref:Uncharacterized protein n=1 Tax=Elysia crispata TaxID=231223 RepID=A0AAE0ZMI0_9GAST|nr:hypothetical protein RRG08_008278 [Elysia crispata]